MVGLGGVTAELFKDVAIQLAPVSEIDAENMLRRLTSFPLLDGWRGAAKADLAAARHAISAISHLAAAEPKISLIEVNPLRIMTNGALALDAIIETA
jgi:hypothetical protein